MNKNILLLLLFVLQISTSYGQETNFNGSRNSSLAEATVGLSSSWSLFTNPAGMEYHKKEVLIGYQSKYIDLGIHDGAFGFAFPVKNTQAGLGVAYFGDELLNKIKAISSVAHTIGKTSLGIKTSYEQWSISELGSKAIVYFNLGGQMEISKQIIVGMELSNLNQAKFDTLTLSSPVTSVKAGLNYHPHDKLLLLAQVEKDLNNPALLRLGMEYLITPILAFRTGLLPSPATGYSGIGLDWPQLHFDLAGSYQQEIGWSGSFSIDVPLFGSNEE